MWSAIVSNKKSRESAFSSSIFASATARFLTHSSATPVQVPRLIQRQNSDRCTRGRALSGRPAADRLLVETIYHELANFVR